MRNMRSAQPQEQPPVRSTSSSTSRSRNHRPRPVDIIPVRIRQITTPGSQPVRAAQRTNSNRTGETALGRHVPSRTNGLLSNVPESAGHGVALQPSSRVMPVLGSSGPVDDQTTWVEDVPSSRNLLPATEFDPNESILASSSRDPSTSTIEPLDPNRQEFPPMFTELAREFAERERRSQQSQRGFVSVRGLNGEFVQLNIRPDNNTPDLSPYVMANYQGSLDETAYRAPEFEESPSRPPTVRPKELRPRILPPIAKGKISAHRPVISVQEVVDSGNQMVSAQRSGRYSQSDAFEPAPFSVSPIQPLRSSTPSVEVSVETPVETPAEDNSYLANLTSEDLINMSEKEVLEVTNSFYYSCPHQKFRANYPFLAEGIVQKDCETGELRVYSQRLGKIMIEDTREKKEDDYVYFTVVQPGVYRGFSFYKHPNCLISAKFPSMEQIVLRGYAILAHPVGSREESMRDNHWVCWNDSLGMMPIIKGSALIPFKKYPVWDKQLDIISFKAGFHNRRFVVEQVVVLTNLKEKQDHFPQEAFLVTDGRFVREGDADLEFHSGRLKAKISIKKMLVGTVDYRENRNFELVVVPTFPGMTNPQFRGLLIINMPCTFWSKDKEWIRKRLADRAQAYWR